MDILNAYIQKNLKSENVKLTSINELFTSDENISKLTRILYRELYLASYSPESFNTIKEQVLDYATRWSNSVDNNGRSNLEKFISKLSNNYTNTANEQLDYINHLFISYYRNKLLNGKTFIQHEIDNNPYKHIYSYKINNNKMHPIDMYNNIPFNNYNTKYTTNLQFSDNYNKIPYYEKALYKKNIDTTDNGSFRERKLLNNNFKKYNNDELFNNVSYLRANN